MEEGLKGLSRPVVWLATHISKSFLTALIFSSAVVGGVRLLVSMEMGDSTTSCLEVVAVETLDWPYVWEAALEPETEEVREWGADRGLEEQEQKSQTRKRCSARNQVYCQHSCEAIHDSLVLLTLQYSGIAQVSSWMYIQFKHLMVLVWTSP